MEKDSKRVLTLALATLFTTLALNAFEDREDPAPTASQTATQDNNNNGNSPSFASFPWR
jgi:hypothetical protein